MAEGKEVSELDIPQPIKPVPAKEGQPARSRVYSEERLRGDYKLFMEEKPGYDPNKPIEDIQRDLFKLSLEGEAEDENQAFEWLLARKWDEFDSKDRVIIGRYSTKEGKKEFRDLWKGKIVR